MADISEKLLIDINSLIKGFVSIPGGNTQKIDGDKVIRRFKEQIAIFAQQRKTYVDAKAGIETKLEGKVSIKVLKTKSKCRKKKIPPFEFQINKPSKLPEGYIWDSDLERCVPENDKIKELLLPPDPVKWGLLPSGSPSELPCGQTEELPCSYATIATIYDMNKKVPSLQIHNDSWNDSLFGLMSYLIDYYDNVKVEDALSNVKNDLLTLLSIGQVKYSLPLMMKTWAVIFKVPENNMKSIRESGKYHFDKVKDKWRLPENELPVEYLEMYRNKIKETS
jgi:hypothetical protein